MSPTRKPDANVLGAILCGGQSARMMQDKSTLIRPDGQLQIEFAAQLLCQFVGAVVICQRRDQQLSVDGRLRRRFDTIENVGPIAGFLSGLAEAEERALSSVLFVPVDLPNLSLLAIEMMFQHWHQFPSQVFVACDHRSRLQPMFSLWPTRLAGDVLRWVTSGRQSIYQLIQSLDYQAIEFSDDLLLNVNTPQEWQIWYEQQGMARNRSSLGKTDL